MPTDWINIRGIITNISTALDLGYRYTPYERINDKSTADILKDIEKVLVNTSVVLETHKDVLPSEEYEELKGKYRNYYWQMTNESRPDQAHTDELVRQSRILSHMYANRGSQKDRAKNLLHSVETYQRTVLSASRNASQKAPIAFADAAPTISELSQSVSETSISENSYTSWFSAAGRSTRSSNSSLDHEAGVSSISSSTGAEGQEFIVSITHFPKTPNSSEEVRAEEVENAVVGTGSTIYRRMISFENDEKRIDIIDPKLYALDKDETYVPESTLQAMSELGASLLSKPDTGVLKRAQIAAPSKANSLPAEF